MSYSHLEILANNFPQFSSLPSVTTLNRDLKAAPEKLPLFLDLMEKALQDPAVPKEIKNKFTKTLEGLASDSSKINKEFKKALTRAQDIIKKYETANPKPQVEIKIPEKPTENPALTKAKTIESHYQRGQQALLLKDNKEAIKYLKLAADEGHSQAAFTLGYHLSASNPKEAVVYLQKAAEKGHPEALFEMGIAYAEGTLVAKNDKRAAESYYQAAKQGHVDAAVGLAVLYLQGKGVPHDLKKGVSLLEEAANKGNASAQYNLALLYETGEGIQQNTEKFSKYMHLAAKNGSPEAQHRVGLFYFDDDPKQAVQYLMLAANQGHPNAQFLLAIAYEEGRGVEQNPAEALKLYQKAAKNGHAQANDELPIIQARLTKIPRSPPATEYTAG